MIPKRTALDRTWPIGRPHSRVKTSGAAYVTRTRDPIITNGFKGRGKGEENLGILATFCWLNSKTHAFPKRD
jgi:hypothetical protein